MELLALNGTDATPHVSCDVLCARVSKRSATRCVGMNSRCYTPLPKTLSLYTAQRRQHVNETAYGETGEQHPQGESNALGEKPLPMARCPMAWDRTGPPPSAYDDVQM